MSAAKPPRTNKSDKRIEAARLSLYDSVWQLDEPTLRVAFPTQANSIDFLARLKQCSDVCDDFDAVKTAIWSAAEKRRTHPVRVGAAGNGASPKQFGMPLKPADVKSAYETLSQTAGGAQNDPSSQSKSPHPPGIDIHASSTLDLLQTTPRDSSCQSQTDPSTDPQMITTLAIDPQLVQISARSSVAFGPSTLTTPSPRQPVVSLETGYRATPGESHRGTKRLRTSHSEPPELQSGLVRQSLGSGYCNNEASRQNSAVPHRDQTRNSHASSAVSPTPSARFSSYASDNRLQSPPLHQEHSLVKVTNEYVVKSMKQLVIQRNFILTETLPNRSSNRRQSNPETTSADSWHILWQSTSQSILAVNKDAYTVYLWSLKSNQHRSPPCNLSTIVNFIVQKVPGSTQEHLWTVYETDHPSLSDNIFYNIWWHLFYVLFFGKGDQFMSLSESLNHIDSATPHPQISSGFIKECSRLTTTRTTLNNLGRMTSDVQAFLLTEFNVVQQYEQLEAEKTRLQSLIHTVNAAVKEHVQCSNVDKDIAHRSKEVEASLMRSVEDIKERIGEAQQSQDMLDPIRSSAVLAETLIKQISTDIPTALTKLDLKIDYMQEHFKRMQEQEQKDFEDSQKRNRDMLTDIMRGANSV